MTTLAIVSTSGALVAAVCFVMGLHLMRTPASARRGNLLSATGMAVVLALVIAVAIATQGATVIGWVALVAGLAVGAVFGAYRSRTVKMTDVPQLVSLFNAVGGGAAAIIGFVDFSDRLIVTADVSVPVVLDVLIGSVTLSGSFVAAGKLQGIIPGSSISFVGARVLNVVVVAIALGASVMTIVLPHRIEFLAVAAAAALVFGALMVLPIGGADAPVVVSLLNAFTGLAVAMAGFVLDSQAMIIAGAIVGAAGTILTLQMAAAMNRSVLSIIIGGFGGAPAIDDTAAAQEKENVRQVSADDVGIQLAYAQQVIIVPGYGLAAGQAQHEVADLARLLGDHGVAVSYAIHPVAGRMPGHMNVLLAEANVPYAQMLQLDEANAAFPSCDVAVVIGANDVTNPAARRPGNPVSGMPILDVDQAKSVVVIKRSMSPGYAGIPNELFTNPKTGMLFADAKDGLAQIIAAVKTNVTA
jgi:NAD(P) transhydrogenase subunit beta